LHGKRLISGLSRYGFHAKFIEIPDGEEYKSLSTVSDVYDSLLKGKGDRTTALISFGGGVVGDLAGFVAATYMRGIPFIHIPTTLLAQVDSSIGGKVAVDHPMAKNIIGSFYHPRATFIDPLVLKTLPLKHLRNGLAEIIKISVISSPSLFEMLDTEISQVLEKDMKVLKKMITDAVNLKVQLVLQDPKEKNIRKYLNFGHSIGHALEAVFGYDRLSHGEAVALGMIIETRISRNRGICSVDLEKKIESIIKKLNIPFRIALEDKDNENIWNTIAFDKKNSQGRICFVLPEKIGKVKLIDDISEKEVFKTLKEFNKECL